ncbi:MAG: acyltransferase family protein [Desulfobacteraceae bacterium]
MQTNNKERTDKQGKKLQRRYDIDWLRVLVMLAVFFFHCARFFGGGTWHLNNDTQSIVALLFIGWLDVWFMPLFFLLSGVGAWHTLYYRNAGEYLKRRVQRILIPLYTIGLFFLLPPQFFFELFSNHGYTGTFWGMLPRYFQSLLHFSVTWPGGLLPLPFSGHLWFLQYLFLVSLIALPLLHYLKSENGWRFMDRLAGWSERQGGIFIFLIPVLLIRIGMRSIFLGEHTWADFFEFYTYFVIGYIITTDKRFTISIKKHGWFCMVMGLIGFGGEVFFVLGLDYNYTKGEPFSLIFTLFETIMGISRWSWMVFVLSLGANYFNFKNKFLVYANEAVLPFYIFHQTIILCVGWYVIPLNVGILIKYGIIAVVSFLVIMALYGLLVKPFNTTRFFFGMQPIHRR